MKIFTNSFWVASLVLLMWSSACRSDKADKKEQPKERIQATLVVAKREMKANQLRFSARVMPRRQAKISTKLMGHVKEVLTEEGQLVSKGQLLVRLDNKDLKAKKEQVLAERKAVETQLKNIRKDYERISRLFEKKSASEKEMDDIQTAFESTKAKLQAVKNQAAELDQLLSYSLLKAPFSGTVSRKFLNEGDLASPGMPVIAVEGNESFKAVGRVPEKDIALLRKDSGVEVYVEAIGKSLPATISQVNYSNRFSGAQYEVTALLTGKDEALRSGMHAYLLLAGQERQGLSVPAEALVRRGQLKGLYVVNSDKEAKLRWVRTGKARNGKVQILSGLKEGETYVLKAKGRIRDGVSVL
ncbi:MAG: efflux RND transporter periplasmic adaptor subunit [Cytophagales bacterium]|nr:efflux RND transporter periplasmic adaptor subunit [Cytophagales bacterium]